jgi:hypothetical protein
MLRSYSKKTIEKIILTENNRPDGGIFKARTYVNRVSNQSEYDSLLKMSSHMHDYAKYMLGTIAAITSKNFSNAINAHEKEMKLN